MGECEASSAGEAGTLDEEETGFCGACAKSQDIHGVTRPYTIMSTCKMTTRSFKYNDQSC